MWCNNAVGFTRWRLWTPLKHASAVVYVWLMEIGKRRVSKWLRYTGCSKKSILQDFFVVIKLIFFWCICCVLCICSLSDYSSGAGYPALEKSEVRLFMWHLYVSICFTFLYILYLTHHIHLFMFWCHCCHDFFTI